MSLPNFNILYNFYNFTTMLGKPQVSYLAKFPPGNIFVQPHMDTNHIHHFNTSLLAWVRQARPHTDCQPKLLNRTRVTQWAGTFMYLPPTLTTDGWAPTCTLHQRYQLAGGRLHTLAFTSEWWVGAFVQPMTHATTITKTSCQPSCRAAWWAGASPAPCCGSSPPFALLLRWCSMSEWCPSL